MKVILGWQKFFTHRLHAGGRDARNKKKGVYQVYWMRSHSFPNPYCPTPNPYPTASTAASPLLLTSYWLPRPPQVHRVHFSPVRYGFSR
ncbi:MULTISPECIES: hypothetical protein [Scytonema]|uniref:Uncharacterized protein n=1 Tax=Scytonema tolypothrichoides VB-61278_2 TaxID=3232314 RepID=A0ABW8X177_9CYAN